MEMEMGTPPPVTRALEIDIGDQEVITIDLDALDQSTDDVINVLQDAQCRVATWTQLASEYWRRGWLDSAQKIAHAALECMCLRSHLCRLSSAKRDSSLQKS